MEQNRYSFVSSDGTKIYHPRSSTRVRDLSEVIPEGETNTITDNYTATNGRIYNVSEENIVLAKHEVDDNKK